MPKDAQLGLTGLHHPPVRAMPPGAVRPAAEQSRWLDCQVNTLLCISAARPRLEVRAVAAPSPHAKGQAVHVHGAADTLDLEAHLKAPMQVQLDALA